MVDPLLIVHTFYQRPGGEDAVYRAEAALLEAHGHTVERLEFHNDELNSMSRLGAARRAIHNGSAAEVIEQRVRRTRARIVHFHNTFPLLSPSVYVAARRGGARVIQTLHNYRLVCPSALMLRDGAPCDLCVGRAFAWPAVRYACYRDSRAASAVVATMLSAHRLRGTWTSQVDAYIAVSDFLGRQVARGGIPRERILVKGPHLQHDPGCGSHDQEFVLFAGRLSEEKGVRVLLEAWARLRAPIELRIFGDGPLRDEVEAAAARDTRIRLVGHVPAEDVVQAMQRARLLVAPSVWYEGAPVVFAEAAATGLPVVSTRIGAIPESVEDGVSGVLVPPRDAQALADAVALLWADTARRVQMQRAARRRFEERMSAGAAYARLAAIYEQVSEGKHR